MTKIYFSYLLGLHPQTSLLTTPETCDKGQRVFHYVNEGGFVALYPTQGWGLFALRTDLAVGGLELSVPIPLPSGGGGVLKVQNISSQWPMI